MRTVHIMLLCLTCSLLLAAQEAGKSDRPFEQAGQEVRERVLGRAGEKLTPEMLKPYEITTRESVTRSPETGKVIFVNVNTYRGGTLIENHTKRDSRRTGKLDHFFQRFYVNGEVIAFIDRHFGEEPVSGNGHGVNGQAGIDVVFSDDDRDGRSESILIMDVSGNEPRMVEAYRLGEDGFYTPASAEDYYRAAGYLHTIAPIMSATEGAIKGAKKKAADRSLDE